MPDRASNLLIQEFLSLRSALFADKRASLTPGGRGQERVPGSGSATPLYVVTLTETGKAPACCQVLVTSGLCQQLSALAVLQVRIFVPIQQLNDSTIPHFYRMKELRARTIHRMKGIHPVKDSSSDDFPSSDEGVKALKFCGGSPIF